MKHDNLKDRTKAFAIRIIKLVDRLPNEKVANIIANQIVRSGTSVGANYRAACRARSQADFISKLGIVEEEADETLYWLEILEESGILKPNLLDELKKENNEIISIIVASSKTAKINKTTKK